MGKIMRKSIVISIAGAVTWVIVICLIAMFAMDSAEIIDLDDVFLGVGSTSKSYGVNSPTVNGMLKACHFRRRFNIKIIWC